MSAVDLPRPRPEQRCGFPRLLHVTTIPGTLWCFLRGQATYIRACGYEVHAVSSPGRYLGKFAESEGVECHAVAMQRRIAPVADCRSLVLMCLAVWRIRPQIVHAHTPKAGLLGMFAAWLLRVPVRIYQIHGLPYLGAQGRRRTLLRAVERLTCSLATQVVCVGPSMKRIAAADGVCPPEKLRLLANGSVNGVDARATFNPARYGSAYGLRSALGIPKDGLVLGFVGRVVRDKGIHELMFAWKTLREELPDAHLLLLGYFEAEDAISPAVRAEILSDPRVHALGHVDEAAPYYPVIDVLVLPTFREGLGYAALEAAAMTIPVVATRIPGCVDAVEDGVTGTLIPPGDATAIVEAVRTYASDPDLRRRHGEAGRQRVLRDFERERVWRAVESLYRELLGGSLVRVPQVSAMEAGE